MNEEYEITRFNPVYSEIGHSAYVYESVSDAGELTQVLLEYAGGHCGSGVVHAYQIDAGLELSWLSPTELLVTKPEGVVLEHNASGERLMCGKHIVHVHVRVQSKAST